MTTPDQPTGMNELRELLKTFGQEWWNVEEGQADRGRTTDMVIAEAEAAIQQIVERCTTLKPSKYTAYDSETMDAFKEAVDGICHNLQQAGLLRGDERDA